MDYRVRFGAVEPQNSYVCDDLSVYMKGFYRASWKQHFSIENSTTRVMQKRNTADVCAECVVIQDGPSRSAERESAV